MPNKNIKVCFTTLRRTSQALRFFMWVFGICIAVMTRRWLPLLSILVFSKVLASEGMFETTQTHLQWEVAAREGAQYRKNHSEAIAAMNLGDSSKAEKELRKIINWCESESESGTAKAVAVSTAEESKLYLATAEGGLPIVWVDMVCPASYKMLAFLFVNSRATDSALRYLDLAATIAPYWAEPYAERGYIMNQLGRFAEARIEYQKALDLATLHPSSSYVIPMALRGIGFSLIELGDLDAAKAAFERSLTIEPKNDLAIGELRYIESLRNRTKGDDGE